MSVFCRRISSLFPLPLVLRAAYDNGTLQFSITFFKTYTCNFFFLMKGENFDKIGFNPFQQKWNELLLGWGAGKIQQKKTSVIWLNWRSCICQTIGSASLKISKIWVIWKVKIINKSIFKTRHNIRIHSKNYFWPLFLRYRITCGPSGIGTWSKCCLWSTLLFAFEKTTHAQHSQ